MGLGQDFLNNLPEYPSPERDKMILDAVDQGYAYCDWKPVKATYGNHEAIFMVSDDAVRVDLDDGSRFRFQVSATLTQKCADVLDASLLTARVCDLAYLQADIVLDAITIPANPDMVTTTKSKLYNSKLETARAGRTGLLRDCGKAWILSNRLGEKPNGAVNYGYYSKQAPYVNPHGIKIWQNLGTFHDHLHTDFSQILLLMQKNCTLDNVQNIDVISIMTDHNLCGLISDEGALKYTRQL